MLRVAAYCRVSTNQDDQANSFESQQRYFLECIARNPEWELQKIYADEGISGTSTQKRRQFNAMIAAARRGEIDLIITKEVSRFARNTLDTLQYTRELQRLGIRVIFLIDHIDTGQQEGELRLTIMSSMAQEESRKTSQRVKWGQTRRMEQGVVFGGCLLGYDVARGALTVQPEGAAVVRWIFYQYLYEHKSARAIARELRTKEVLSSRGNCKWSAATVLKILKNEKYCGDLIQKKTYTPDYLTHEKKYNQGQEELVILRDHHEPIIHRNMWEQVQQERKRRSRQGKPDKGRGNRYLLSGKIRCGECASSFLARKKQGASGTSYRVWRCAKATREGAGLQEDGEEIPRGCRVGRQLREETAMELLRQSVESVQLDREEISRRLVHAAESAMEQAAEGGGTQQHRLEEELERERQKKRRALEAYMDAAISPADFQFFNCCCDREIADLENRLTQARERQGAWEEGQGAAVRAAIQQIVQGGGDDAFYAQLLDHITVYGDGRTEVVLQSLPTRWIFML